MNPLYISEPCSENWAAMSPTEKGSFCTACAKEVIDFSTKKPHEIAAILKQNLGKSVCGRIGVKQLDLINKGFYAWEESRVQHMRVASYLAILAVFGMSLFSCQSLEAEANLQQIQRTVLISQGEAMHQVPQIQETITAELPDLRLLESRLEHFDHATSPDREFVKMEEMEFHQMTEMREVTMGAMVYVEQVVEYLELVPLEPVSRYDMNGVLIPAVHEDLVYPNPTYGQATYKLALPQEGVFVIGLYDMSGRHIRNLHEGDLEAGTHEFDLNLMDEQPGTFLVVCRSKNFSNTQRLIKL